MLLFSYRASPKNLQNENIFLYLEITEIDIGGGGGGGVNFESRRTILDIKTHPFKVKPVF